MQTQDAVFKSANDVRACSGGDLVCQAGACLPVIIVTKAARLSLVKMRCGRKLPIRRYEVTALLLEVFKCLSSIKVTVL